jgi:hypothetical protein
METGRGPTIGEFYLAQETERAWARMELNRRLICTIIDADPAGDERRKKDFFNLRKKYQARQQFYTDWAADLFNPPSTSDYNVMAKYEDSLAAAMAATKVALDSVGRRADYGLSETLHGSRKKTIQLPSPPPKWSLYLPRGSKETNTITVCSSKGCLVPADHRCQHNISGFPKEGRASKVRCWRASCDKHFTFEVTGHTTVRLCEECVGKWVGKEEEPPLVMAP